MSTSRDDANQSRTPQTEEKHPDQWQRDLNPSHMAGQNVGQASGTVEHALPTAYDVKEVHRTLNDGFADDELKQIPVLRPGQRLQQGATYVDLSDPERREFTAMGDMEAREDGWLIPKQQVPYSLWNRLTGVDNPERIAERRPEQLGD